MKHIKQTLSAMAMVLSAALFAAFAAAFAFSASLPASVAPGGNVGAMPAEVSPLPGLLCRPGVQMAGAIGGMPAYCPARTAQAQGNYTGSNPRCREIPNWADYEFCTRPGNRSEFTVPESVGLCELDSELVPNTGTPGPAEEYRCMNASDGDPNNTDMCESTRSGTVITNQITVYNNNLDKHRPRICGKFQTHQYGAADANGKCVDQPEYTPPIDIPC